MTRVVGLEEEPPFVFFLVMRPYGGWMARRDQSGALLAGAGRYTRRTPDTAAKRRAGKIPLHRSSTRSRTDGAHLFADAADCNPRASLPDGCALGILQTTRRGRGAPSR